jgi:hypothetical protein
MTPADRKLQKQLKAWRAVCPENVGKVEDVRKALGETRSLLKDLEKISSQLQRGAGDSEYEDYTAKSIARELKTVSAYLSELNELEQRMGELKKFLSRVRTSAEPLPFALVAKGTSQGSLHVHKRDKPVERESRHGKQEISGAQIHEGTCCYEGGKLVFRFAGGMRAPWKSLIQDMVDQAGVNMKVKLDGSDADEADNRGGQSAIS